VPDKRRPKWGRKTAIEEASKFNAKSEKGLSQGKKGKRDWKSLQKEEEAYFGKKVPQRKSDFCHASTEPEERQRTSQKGMTTGSRDNINAKKERE